MTRLTLLLGAAPLAAAYNFGIPSNNLAGAHQLANIDPDQEACATAGDVVSYCVDYLPYDAAVTDSASCFCCDAATFLAPVYSSCEDYIVASAPEYTEDYSASNEGFRCGSVAAATTTGSGGATQTGGNTFPSATATNSEAVETFGGGGGGAATAQPPACTSFASMYSSCDANVRGFETMDDSQAASCLCYVNGKFTTALDDYISECGVWAKTADPEEYESYVAIESFCELFQGGVSASATGGDVATFGGGGGSDSSSTDAALTFNTNTNTNTNTPTTTHTQHTVTVTPTPTAAKNAAAGPVQAGSGLAAWLAVVLPFVM
ncbi:hypothetical protein Sste5344_004042 [Sporothrix stenoceras]